MKLELLVYTSVFSLMVAMPGSLLGMEPEEKAPTLRKAAASSDQSSAEDWRTPFFQKKYCLSGPSLNLEGLKKEIIRISLNHPKSSENQEHLLSIERIKSLLNDDSDENVNEFLYRVYSGGIMKTSPFNNLQKAAEMLDRAYAQEETWSFWTKAMLAPKGQLTRDHYLAANRGHKEAIAYVKANTPYKAQIAYDFCNQLMKQKFQTKIIDEFKEKWEREGYAQPFLHVLILIKNPILSLIKDSFLKIAADLGDVGSQWNIVCAKPPSDDKGTTFPYLIKAAKQGHVNAMYNLGVLLQDRNPEEAEKWYRKAANLGNANAMTNLGVLLHDKNPVEAETWLRKAANLGDVEAMHSLGVLLENQKKLEDAKTCYRKAADLNDPQATFNLGLLLHRQNELEDAKTCYRKAADLGQVEAMNNLGLLLEEQNNLKEAVTCYRKAADLKHTGAIFNLGVLLHKQNKLEEAETCYRKAADLKHTGAMNNLGALLQDRNPEETETWLRKAVDLGHVAAMNNLSAVLYKQNKLEEAETWLRKVVDLKDADVMSHAMGNLGAVLHRQNKLKDAEIWYRKAALRGFAPSMIQLGKLYLDRGAFADALFWLEKAAALGDQDARQLLQVSQKSLQPLALRNDRSSEASVTVKMPEDVEIDSELDEIFEKIENPELQTISSVQRSEQKSPLSETPASDETSFSSEDELEEGPIEAPIPAPEATAAPDVQPKIINNPKTRREKARLLGRELQQIAEEAQNPNRQLAKGPQEIANAILSGVSDHITQADLKTLFKDPYFGGQVIVEPTKSGFTVLSHHRVKKVHLNAGAHRKHGQEKYTGFIHPNTLKGIKEILNTFDVEKK